MPYGRPTSFTTKLQAFLKPTNSCCTVSYKPLFFAVFEERRKYDQWLVYSVCSPHLQYSDTVYVMSTSANSPLSTTREKNIPNFVHSIYDMDVQPFFGKRPQLSMRDFSRATCVEVTSGIPNGLNYCVIFRVCTKFTNVAAGGVTQTDGPLVAHPYFTVYARPSSRYIYAYIVWIQMLQQAIGPIEFCLGKFYLVPK